MKTAKGFKGRYFSLAAILALNAGVSLLSANDSLLAQESDEATQGAYAAKVQRYAQSELGEGEERAWVESYTAQDFARSYAQNVYEFLQQKTLLMAKPNYGNPFVQSLDMRGYGENGHQNIAIIVDGVRREGIDMNPISLSFLPLDAIEKIEIIRGLGSVRYGDGAHAGILNITTKRQSGGLIHLSSGSHATHDGRFYGRYVQDTLNIGAYAQGLNTEGDRKIDEGDKKDAKKNRNAGGSLFFTPSEKLLLRANGDYGQYDAKYANPLTQKQFLEDPSQAGVGHNHYARDEKRALGGATYHLSDEWQVSLDGSGYSATGEWRGSSPSVSKYRGESLELGTSYDFGGHRLEVGSTFKENLRQDDAPWSHDSLSKDSDAYWATLSKEAGAHFLKIGTRHERVAYRRDGGTYLDQKHHSLQSYEAAYEYALLPETKLFIAYQHAFLAPDVDRFFKFGGGFNEFIDPSKSDTYQLGARTIQGRHALSGTFFYTRLRHEIYYNPATWTNTNLDQSEKRGVEISYKTKWLPELSTSIEYAFVQAKILEETQGALSFAGKELPGASKHTLHLGIEYQPLSSLTLLANYKYGSKAYAYEDFANTQTKTPSYKNLSLGASYHFKDWEFYAYINNLLDDKNAILVRENAYYPYDFERTFGAGVKYFF
ncbi:TonB-dependent receptor [Wolinella succinogenes]|uniref:TonB-dependent receptor n=1 Tax=Wolinella succinogenes TaxID=844 RepID=UPI00240997DD|nr:TonB-dependent receptor [Wolinella succinogenes]